jgi:hypothetical protein
MERVLASARDRVIRSAETLRHVGPQQVPEAVLVGALWWYSASVLYPAKVLRRSSPRLVGPPTGDVPTGLPLPGSGPYFSTQGPELVMLSEPARNYQLVEDFDRLAQMYEVLVRPFSTPIFDEALQEIRGYLTSDSRVLDAACGPGRELRRVAALVPRGEVVGIDLAAGRFRCCPALVSPSAKRPPHRPVRPLLTAAAP